ncbi:flagellar protein [Thiospirochaeta perfilievii]|uniref:Flagellar protein n=1 Tax=Thiospirochaeta perfilievii TaxID=252967 RepID=A0A5C1Q596_9SPIO|nr:flagellar filament outer layer protein FlaA [Thiospirochaeta perfilievii]QEN03233.1 flagellar protein [Thiospirochaeta perfilievii]
MKRLLALLGFTLLLTTTVFAETATIIDFADLTADQDGLNTATIIDYSSVAGTTYADDEKAQMKESLFVESWDVVLNKSAQSVTNDRLSFTQSVIVKETAKRFAGEQVMGVRVHFPESFESNALVKPPFDIPAYMPSDEELEQGIRSGNKFNNYGVLKNVGAIKSISVNVYGRNFPHKLILVFSDSDGNEKYVPVGDLNFNGWRTLTWNNPNYITEVKYRELNTAPIYPVTSNSLIFKGLLVKKSANHKGGDFVSYFKNIDVTFDKAIRDDIESDIDDEAVWGILANREEARRNNELRTLGNSQILEYLEQKKMDQLGSAVDKREQIPLTEATATPDEQTPAE